MKDLSFCLKLIDSMFYSKIMINFIWQSAVCLLPMHLLCFTFNVLTETLLSNKQLECVIIDKSILDYHHITSYKLSRIPACSKTTILGHYWPRVQRTICCNHVAMELKLLSEFAMASIKNACHFTCYYLFFIFILFTF